MPKFLVEATYTTEGYRGLAKDKASGRKAAIVQAGGGSNPYFNLTPGHVVSFAHGDEEWPNRRTYPRPTRSPRMERASSNGLVEVRQTRLVDPRLG